MAFFACIAWRAAHLRDRVSFSRFGHAVIGVSLSLVWRWRANWVMAHGCLGGASSLVCVTTRSVQYRTALRLLSLAVRSRENGAIGHTEDYVDGTVCITVHMQCALYILKQDLNPSARTQGPLRTD